MTYITVIFGLITFLICVPFASLPRSTRMMDRAQLAASIIFTLLLFAALMCTYFLGSRSDGWVAIVCALIGFAIGHIRVINEFFAEHWDIFELR